MKKAKKKSQIIPEATLAELRRMNEEELKTRLVQQSQLLLESIRQMKDDPAIQAGKTTLKNLMESYREDQKTCNAVIEEIVSCLESQGKA